MSLIILKAYGIAKSSLNILMEGTPSDVDLEAVISTITKDERIQNVHDYHVWTISNDMNALSCHAVVSEQLTVKECENLLETIEHDLLHQNVQHMTHNLKHLNINMMIQHYVQVFMNTYTLIHMPVVIKNILKGKTLPMSSSLRIFNYLHKVLKIKSLAGTCFSAKPSINSSSSS